MKACLQLWTQLHINLPSYVGDCCMKPYSNIKVDYENSYSNDFFSIINRKEMVDMRKKFLRGEIPKICTKCGNMEEFTSNEEFISRLEKEGVQYQVKNREELAHINSISELCVEFTTSCNFKCIYCVHGSPLYKIKPQKIDIEKFCSLFDSIQEQLQVQQLTTIGIGEFTVLPDWQKIIQHIDTTYPEVKINIYSNFGKEFTEEDIAVLCKARLLTISCDTFDKDLFHKMRSGNLDTVMNNVRRVIAYKMQNNLEYPKVQIAGVLNSESINTLEEFVQKLGENNLCDSLILSPMNLPKAYADKIGIYPIATNENTQGKDEINQIKTLFNNVKEKGEQFGISIIFSGELSNLADM